MPCWLELSDEDMFQSPLHRGSNLTGAERTDFNHETLVSIPSSSGKQSHQNDSLKDRPRVSVSIPSSSGKQSHRTTVVTIVDEKEVSIPSSSGKQSHLCAICAVILQAFGIAQ